MALISDATTLNILARVASLELASQENDLKASCIASMPQSLTIQDTANSPILYLERLFAQHGIRLSGRRCNPSKTASTRPSFEEIEAYSMETALAVRRGDLDTLKELYYDQGFSLSACNRFGESLLHICCRRGHAKMMEFMMTEAKVNPRVFDDMGRSAFHDVCWSSEPNLEAMDVLLGVLPPIGLLMQDRRGHTPLHYAPRKHWGVWLEYLQAREHIFVNWIRTKRERAAAPRQQRTPPTARVVSPSA